MNSKAIASLGSTSAIAILAGLGISSSAVAQEASTQSASVSEVVVTGTSIRGVAAVGSAVIGIDLATLQAAAPRSSADLLTAIPQIAQFNTAIAPTANTSGGVSRVSLRPNLGVNATLILLDGHRLPASGALSGTINVSAIPTGAIARVDVVSDGASAIYGSDAVAGVINFVTRRRYDGAETSARYSSASRYDGYDISQTYGKSWSTGSFLIAAQVSQMSGLKTSDRDYWSDVGTTSPGLNTACPVASIGASVPLCDAARIGGYLQAKDIRPSVFANITQDLTPNISVWADVLMNREIVTGGIVQPALPTATFSAANPFNTTGAVRTIFYRPVTEFGGTAYQQYTNAITNFDGGVDFKLAHDWAGKLTGTWGRTHNYNYVFGTDNVAYTQAMAATTAATAFDPFGHKTSSTVLAQVADGATVSDVKITLGTLDLKFDGPVVTLPAGEVRAAVGAGYRYDGTDGAQTVGSPSSLRADGSTGYLSVGRANGSRNVGSFYTEWFVPVIAGKTGFEKLSLSLAARYDHYSDFGSTTNPKVGVDWTIVNGLRLYGTWSTAFQAPALGDEYNGAIDNLISVMPTGGGNLQPRGAAYTLYNNTAGIRTAGGGADMQPQKSENYSYGFEIMPSWLKGFRASTTFYHVDFDNFIFVPGANTGLWTDPAITAKYGIVAPIVNGALVPFTPDSPEIKKLTAQYSVSGGVLPSKIYWIVIGNRTNIGSKIQEGFDFDISQRLDLGPHNLTGRVAGTVITKDLSGLTQATATSVLATDSKVRYSATLDDKVGKLSLGLSYNSLGSFYSTTAQTVHVKAFNLVNFRSSYELGGSGLLEGVQLTLNVDNVFDTPPPVQIDVGGGHPASLNMLGRLVTVGVRKRW